ncbi:unnamed protein product [Auanema sp. JU1783]|nr:unnamed protein product [Auanema sp. JU1783]
MPTSNTEQLRISLCTEDDDIILVSHEDKIFNKAFRNLNEIRRSGQLCDICIISQGGVISAHKIVLSAVIPYFRAMFTTDMLEANQKEISLKEMSWEIMEQMVDFAYTGELKISAGNVQDLMIAANFLQLEEVVEDCASFLLARLHPSNVLAVRSFCSYLGSKFIIDVSDNFVQKHFLAVCRSEEFLNLQLDDIIAILAQDSLYVDSEEDIFEAALKWIQYDDTRRKHLSKLLACVRLHLLKPSFLTDRVAGHNLIRADLACRDLVDEAKDYHLMPERRILSKSFRVKSRCCSDVPGLIFAIGGLVAGGNSSAVEMYDPYTKKWTDVRPMPQLRCRVGVAVHDKKIYAIGGFNGTDRLRTVEAYNYLKNEWKLCSPLDMKRSALGAAFLHGKLYVCGGYDGITSLATVEIYDPEKDTWSGGPTMLKQRSAAGVVVLDGYLYVIGGHDGMCIFNSVERYSIETGVWENGTPMLTRRCRLGASVMDGKIYVCGGYDGSQFLNSVESFDPITNTWSTVTPMKIKRSRVSVVANANNLYAIAGYDGSSNLSSIEIYNEEANDWELGPPLQCHEGGVGVGVIPMPPNIF